MSDLFQKIKKESMITSIICIVFGVMFCIWPGTILVTLCRIAGLVLLAAGIVLLVQGIRIREMLGRPCVCFRLSYAWSLVSGSLHVRVYSYH